MHTLGLSAEEINTELLKRGIVFVHGRALDNTRVGKRMCVA